MHAHTKGRVCALPGLWHAHDRSHSRTALKCVDMCFGDEKRAIVEKLIKCHHELAVVDEYRSQAAHVCVDLCWEDDTRVNVKTVIKCHYALATVGEYNSCKGLCPTWPASTWHQHHSVHDKASSARNTTRIHPSAARTLIF